MVPYAPAAPRRARIGRYFAPLALLGLIAAIVLIVNSAQNVDVHGGADKPSHAAVRPRHPYWIVHTGDTYAEIAAKTGLTVGQLQAFNPNVDPIELLPGARLNLWRHPPTPRPKPLGPLFWTVRPGESFGSIAAKTRINITLLEQLNPRLKSTTLQPGDRVRLRR
jgi:LysM repeat protein